MGIYIMDADLALVQLKHFDKQWGGKYPYIIKSRKTNWDKLSTFFKFPLEIRKIIYTTNVIENINWGVRKYTKARTMLPNDQAVKKVVYLSLIQAQKKWTMPHRDWPLCSYSLSIFFGEQRCNLKL